MTRERLSFNSDWENSTFREALVEMGADEALQLFDEEQEAMKAKADEEIEEFRTRGMFMDKKPAQKKKKAV